MREELSHSVTAEEVHVEVGISEHAPVELSFFDRRFENGMFLEKMQLSLIGLTAPKSPLCSLSVSAALRDICEEVFAKLPSTHNRSSNPEM